MKKSSIYNPRVVKTQNIIRHYGWLNREQGPKMDLKFVGESWNLVQRRLHGVEGREGALPPVAWANGSILWGVMKGAVSAFQSGNCVYVRPLLNFPGPPITINIPELPFEWPEIEPVPPLTCKSLWAVNTGMVGYQNAENENEQVLPPVGFNYLECWKMTCAHLWSDHPQHVGHQVGAKSGVVVWPPSLADGDISECWDIGQPDDVPDPPTPDGGGDLGDGDSEADWRVGFVYKYELTRESENINLIAYVDKDDTEWRTKLRSLFPLGGTVRFEKEQHEAKSSDAWMARFSTALDLSWQRQREPTIPRITTRFRDSDLLMGLQSTSDDTTFKIQGVGEHEIIELSDNKDFNISKGEISAAWSVGVPGFLDILDEMSLEEANIYPLRRLNQSYRGEVDGVLRYNEEVGDKASCFATVLVRRFGYLPDLKLEYSCLVPDESEPSGERIAVSYRKLEHNSWANYVGSWLLPIESPYLTSGSRTLRLKRISDDTWLPATAPSGYTPTVALSGAVFAGHLLRASTIETYKQGTFWWPTSGPIDVRRQFSEVGPPGPPEPSRVPCEISFSEDSDEISDASLSLDIPYQKWYIWESTGEHWEGLSSSYYATFGVKVVGLWDED